MKLLLLETLGEIANGKQLFKPADTTAEAREQFQPLGQVLATADECGFLNKLDIRRESVSGARAYTIALVAGGLSPAGIHFLSTNGSAQ